MAQFSQLLTAARHGQIVHIVTLVDTPPEERGYCGQMLFVYPDGKVSGCLVDETFTNMVLQELSQQKWRNAHLMEFDYQGRYRVFWDCLLEKKKVVILGGGHIGRPLADILATLDFKVTVVDDRLDFANRERFPHADKVICENFVMALLGMKLDFFTAVVIVTRSYKYDLECLRFLVGKKIGYLGMIGSPGKMKRIRELLAAENVNSDFLTSLHAPIGLDIGAESPAEIALSIAAEMISVFNGGTGRSCTVAEGMKNG